jgi:hypothetical protein
MVKRNLFQAEIARMMRNSRTVIRRLLDPRDTSVTLATLVKASKALGVKLLRGCVTVEITSPSPAPTQSPVAGSAPADGGI